MTGSVTFIIYLDCVSDSLKTGYPGFDWFAATVFLIFNGNHEKAWDFLQQFSTLGASGYLWIPRLHASVSYIVTLATDNYYSKLATEIAIILIQALLQFRYDF
jgi:hypothetical protein